APPTATFFSATATVLPSWAAATAALTPAGPAPITTTSNACDSLMVTTPEPCSIRESRAGCNRVRCRRMLAARLFRGYTFPTTRTLRPRPMPTVLSDPSPTLYVILGALVIIFGAIAARRQKRSDVINFAIPAVLLLALFLIDRAFESPREQV